MQSIPKISFVPSWAYLYW